MKKQTYLVLTVVFIVIASILLYISFQIQTNGTNSSQPLTLTPSVPSNDTLHNLPDSLIGTSWDWQFTQDLNQTVFSRPLNDHQFILRFDDENRISSQTDCNTLGANYTATESTISFSELAATQMFCEGSMEDEYSSQLQSVVSYSITDNTLRLTLENQAGEMIFDRVD